MKSLQKLKNFYSTVSESNTPQTYDLAAEAYNAHIDDPKESPLHAYYEKPAIHAEFPNLTGLSVLNLGCGGGQDAQWLKTNGADRVYASDISRGLIEIAHTHYPAINFQVMDMSHLGYQNECFDVAYSSLALHYIKDWSIPLSEVKRVLKPGGQFIFSCLHPLETALEYFNDQHTRKAYIGRTILEGNEIRTIYGDYMAADDGGISMVKRTVTSEHSVNYFHRTFGKMIESIVQSGFTIQKLVEPLPLEAMKVDNPEHFKQVMKLPKFAIWVLQKEIEIL